MKVRLRKKLARINNDWYKGKIINDYDCPYCSWCALDDEEMIHHKTLSTDRDYFGKIDWDFEVKCPHCGTKFEYSDSSM